ncbi:MAG: hypothetical protein KGD64_01545, partial [Candidatus Heimdallarchaeota archaeon]|nr:hypothetical protein [Candidatus Heimdallarchaeota archaeon]
MGKRSKLAYILLLTAVISGCFVSQIHGNFTEQNPSTLSSSLPQEIIFQFNQTFREQSFTLSLSQVELNRLNSLNMVFTVTGDRSTAEGLEIQFSIDTSPVNFTIDRFYQDGSEHNLSQSFLYPEEFNGAMNVTVICRGQAGIYESGTLIIHSSTSLNQLYPPILSHQSSSLPSVPNSFSKEGTFFSVRRLSFLTAFYFFNETAEANFTLTFNSNCSFAVNPRVEFQLNDQLPVSLEFEEKSWNLLSLNLYPKLGFNVLSVTFVYELPFGLIIIQDINFSAFSFFNANDLSDTIFNLVEWEDEILNHTFNLSSLKPQSDVDEQVITLHLNCKFVGTQTYRAIDYEILSGTRVVYEGEITYLDRLLPAHTISARFVTTTFHEELTLQIYLGRETSGTFSIFNSSTITIDPLIEFNGENLEQLVSSHILITPSTLGITSLSFTNFFKAVNYSDTELTVSFNIISEYDRVFERVLISLTANGSTKISLNKGYQETFDIPTFFHVFLGIYEIKLSLTFFGVKSPFNLTNITYQILPTPEEPADTYMLNWYNIDWILAIYGFLFLVLNEKIILRRRIKRIAKEENYDHPPLEEEEEKKRERNRFILQLIVSFSLYLGFLALLYLFQLNHWSLVALATLCSYYLSTLVEGVSFDKGKIKQGLVKLREFFDEVESFYDLFSKTIETLSRKSRKQMWRAGLIAFIIGSLTTNVLLLFFVADKLQFIIEEPTLFSFFFTDLWQAYYFLYACVIFSTLAIYYAAHYVRTMAFVEDNLCRTRVLGKASILLLTTSILCLNIIILGTVPDFSALWTFLSPLFFLGVVKASNNLGEVLAEEEKDEETTRIISLKEYLRNGKVWTNKREMRQALGYGITTRTTWLKEKHNLQKKQLNGTIIWNITSGIQVPIARLAELAKLTKKRTELLLQEILNEQPKLGKYYKEEQVFIKETTDDTIGT